MTDDTMNRFADVTHISDLDEILIQVWFLQDGSVLEVRTDRPSTTIISERVFHANSEQAWAYRAFA